MAGLFPTLLALGLAGAAAASPAAAPSHSPSQKVAPPPVSPASVADSARVFLLTFGPGEEVWERFGHNALWIHDPEAGTDIAYHYGLFDMSEAGFLTRFLRGRMAYSMGDAPALLLIEAYRRTGRDATIQELRLDVARVRALESFLTWNLRPENRVYRYDYFRDNCSTRIRDALDRVLEGRLRADLAALPTPVTYRAEALGLTADDRLLTAGMDLGLGPLADGPLTRWELAFIPMRLRDDVRRATVVRAGEVVPLVVSERRVPPLGEADADMAEPPGAISARVAWMLVIGLLAGALFAALGWLAGRPRSAPPAARWPLATAGAFWGLVTGVLGLILFGLWTLTDHEFAHRNENLLQVNPLALALVVLVPLAVLRRRPRADRAARAALLVAAALAALSVLGLLVQPLPLTPQATLGIIALALPGHLGLLLGLWLAVARARSAGPDTLPA